MLCLVVRTLPQAQAIQQLISTVDEHSTLYVLDKQVLATLYNHFGFVMEQKKLESFPNLFQLLLSSRKKCNVVFKRQLRIKLCSPKYSLHLSIVVICIANVDNFPHPVLFPSHKSFQYVPSIQKNADNTLIGDTNSLSSRIFSVTSNTENCIAYVLMKSIGNTKLSISDPSPRSPFKTLRIDSSLSFNCLWLDAVHYYSIGAPSPHHAVSYPISQHTLQIHPSLIVPPSYGESYRTKRVPYRITMIRSFQVYIEILTLRSVQQFQRLK